MPLRLPIANHRPWWPPAVVIAAALLLLHCLLQGWLWPLELAADEAQYWDWSRRPAISYHTKGPWLAWCIGLSTRLLGDTEFALRIWAYGAHAAATFIAGALGALLSADRRRGALFGALGFAAIAAYQVSGSLITVDMQLVLGWMTGTLLAAQALGLPADARPRELSVKLGLAGLCFGWAFLAKYTALLGALGVGWALASSPVLRSRPGRSSALWLFAGGTAVGLLPVLIWNAGHGWATLAHLRSHLQAPGGSARGFDWRSPLIYLASTFAAANPLIALAVLAAWRERWTRQLGKRSELAPTPVAQPALWETERLLLCSALPVLAFYLAVSLIAPTEGNWAIAAYGPLTVFASGWAARVWPAGSGVERAPRAHGPARGLARAILISGALSLGLVLSLPALADGLQRGLERLGSGIVLPLYRVSGQRAFAEQVLHGARAAWAEHGLPGSADEAPVVADYYSRTALLSFYLPGHPRVRCASLALVGRPSGYDDFSDTRLPDQRLLGQWSILVGQSAERWRAAFQFESLLELGSVTEYGRQRPLLVGRLLGFEHE